MKVPALLKNKYVFYGLAVLAVLNVVGYVSVRAYECLALFVLTAYSAHCYCKNESCAILAALFVANFVFGCGRVKEGFEEAMKAPEDLLKDAAEAASKAGEQLSMQEGNEPAIQACTAIDVAASDAATKCAAAKKGGVATGDACTFTAAVPARCMKDGQAVAMLADGTTATTEQNCTGDVGSWEAEVAAKCE